MPEHRCYCCGSTALVTIAVKPLCCDCAHNIIERAAKVAENERQLQAWRQTPEGRSWIVSAKSDVSLKRALELAA